MSLRTRSRLGATTPFRARALVSDEALRRKHLNPAPTPSREIREVERLGLRAVGLPESISRTLRGRNSYRRGVYGSPKRLSSSSICTTSTHCGAMLTI